MMGDGLLSSVAPAMPPLGDTPYELLTASARATANLLPSWDERAPVVFVGDGSQTQASQNGTAPVTAPADPPSLSSAVSGVFHDALTSALVGAAAIVILGIGAFILLRGD